ncbi:hypothetical protein QTP86_006682 [Hemibagrus guttatus]|nr:hypothetical protein QTP86_006682 [Hemibagrus guttatus]
MPGLTTTAIGAVDLQGAGGNWATVGRRSRGGRRVHRQREKRKYKSVGLRIGTLNVGTMTGKDRELADMMERRKVDILCVQETRWKGSKARSIGAGFKLFYYGVDSKRNGVGVVLKEEFVRNVLEVGCELEEKERFWSELDEVMESIPTSERVVIGADFNGHVGEGNRGDEEVMGKFGVKERNLEGQMVVDFAKRMDMAVVNTYFQKREEHRVTYKSGGRSTQKKRSKIEIEKKTKWWKLKKEECCEEFRQKLRQALGGQVLLPDDWETTAEVIRETGRKVLGVSSGRRKEDKETWWWNEEVQDSIQRKRSAKKKWDMDRTIENRQEYKELQRRVKREVSKAKQKAYDELYTRLDTREGEKDLYSLARQRDRDGKDVQQVRVIKDRDGRVLTSEESVQRRWKEYFEELMNEENEREKRVEGMNSVEQKVDKIRKDEVRKALKRMKSGKAVGPDDIPVEVWKCLGEAAVEFLASLFNRVLENLEKAYDRVPREELWYCMRKSGVAEKYVRVVQDMYERSRTVVKCAVGQTEEFKVEVGLHQGSALSPFLFAIVMDQLSEEVRQESPWTMMFADDIVICSESREQVEENLERWRFALERRGMKVSHSKTEYMCVNEREGSGTVRLQGEEVKKVQEFKYLGSTVQSNGECGKEVKKRVQAGDTMGCGVTKGGQFHKTHDKAIRAAVLIQRWYRQYVSRMEMRRRYTWNIFQSIEYTGLQDQIKLYNFLGYLMDNFTPSSNERKLISHIFRDNEICRDAEWERYFSYSNIDIPEIYSGPRLTFPLDANQAADLVEAFRNKQNGMPSLEKPYVFNGDFVDRGKDSIEILLILFTFLLVYPGEVYLNRGNHEDHIINLRYGFTKEVLGKYKMHGKRILKLLQKIFSWLPLATVIDQKVLIVHGGISDTTDLALVARMHRHKILDLLWSDPMPEYGCIPNEVRGGGCYWGPNVTEDFLNKHNLQLIIRSHECKQDGYEFCHNRKVLTIFSASNYYEVGSNRGALVRLGPDLLPYFIQYQTNSKTREMSFGQSIRRTEHSALKVLREQLFAHKSDLISAFQEYDKKNTGLISLNDWSSAVGQVLHLELPWRMLRSQLLTNTTNDMLDYHNWFRNLAIKETSCEYIEQTLLETLYRHRSTLETIFRIVDTDNSGLISFEDFCQTWKLLSAYLKMEISTEAINDLVVSIDMNKDGYIDIDEFMESFRLVDKNIRKPEEQDLPQDGIQTAEEKGTILTPE